MYTMMLPWYIIYNNVHREYILCSYKCPAIASERLECTAFTIICVHAIYILKVFVSGENVKIRRTRHS